jgi:hypothetical protein
MEDKQLFVVGGLQIHIYGLSLLRHSAPVVVLFLLHGSQGSEDQCSPIISRLALDSLNEKAPRQLLNFSSAH